MGRRSGAGEPSGSVIVFHPFRLDPREQQLWREGRRVPLKPRAFAMLSFLVDHPGKLIARRELFERFWGDAQTCESVLKTQIREIRQALGDRASRPRFIETVHSRGYRFIGRIEGPPERIRRRSRPAGDASSEQVPSPRALHVVGRKAELDFLMSRWATACGGGERQVVFVTGEAGVGKTVLVNEFLREGLSTVDQTLITWGQCVDQYGSGEPYLPIVEALRRACSGPQSEFVTECLRAFAPAWLSQMLIRPATLSTPDVGPGAATAPAERMLGQMVEMLEELSRQIPLALLIEDLHWADPSTLDLLAYLAQRSDRARLMVLGTYRPSDARAGRLPDIEQLLRARDRCITLPVARLCPRAVGEYLDRRFIGHQLPSSLPELLHQRTGGNALFMVGVVDAWLDGGLLEITGTTCHLAASLDALARCVPDNVVRLIERELERASRLERNVLEAASVAGNAFSTAAVSAALSMDTLEIEELCMNWARRGQFLRAAGKAEWHDGTVAERCEFVHVLYQQVIYARVGAARQAQFHRRMAERLSAGYAAQAPEIALHFQRGGDLARAVQYLRISGDQALRQGAYREAIDHLEHALVLIEKLPATDDRPRLELELRVLIAPALRITRGYAALEVEQAYVRAALLCTTQNARAQLLPLMVGMVPIYILRGESGTALHLGTRCLELAEEHRDASITAEATLVLGIALHHLGHHGEAVEYLAQAMARYEVQGPPAHGSLCGRHPAIGARCFLAFSTSMLGHLDRARDEAEAALASARELDDALVVAFALTFSSHVHLLRREPQRAREYAKALAMVCDEHGFSLFSSTATLLTGAAQIDGTDVASSVELLQQGWASLKATGSRVYAKCWARLLASGYCRLGDTQRAAQIIEEALTEGERAGEHLWDAELLRLRGELLVQRNGSDSGVPESDSPESSTLAEDHFSRALEIAKQQSAKLFELRAAVNLARCWRARGQAVRAHTLLASVLDWFTEGHDTLDLVEARQLESTLLAKRR